MTGLFAPFYYEPARHFYRLLTNKCYRTCSFLETSLGRVPRFSARKLKVGRWDLSIPDVASFLSAYREIFVEEIYRFPFAGSPPRILDLGANIGLSVLYFKSLFPEARITALEADPTIFPHLERNVRSNGYDDVELVNRAAWHEQTTLQFSSEGADGGRAALPGDRNLMEVEAIDIRDLLRRGDWDFLKMDIEGGEEFVLPACAAFLPEIRYVFVEYHAPVGRKQCLDGILNVLTEAGFRFDIHSVHPVPSPFAKDALAAGFDLQLNIFAWRDRC